MVCLLLQKEIAHRNDTEMTYFSIKCVFSQQMGQKDTQHVFFSVWSAGNGLY